jgi:hypothetical protein
LAAHGIFLHSFKHEEVSQNQPENERGIKRIAPDEKKQAEKKQ